MRTSLGNWVSEKSKIFCRDTRQMVLIRNVTRKTMNVGMVTRKKEADLLKREWSREGPVLLLCEPTLSFGNRVRQESGDS